LSSNDSYPQYVVTAVIVAHDGGTWLPSVADALAGQTRAVQRVVAVDTGSRDRSGAVLASKFGQAAVFGMDRGTGYGAAVARALAHRAANSPVAGAAGISARDRVEWIWLLHDDCEPAPDALEQLLRGAAETSAAAVLGPKLRDWSNREVILEAGITLDTAARRLTGIEPREVDQGQHDGDRDTLAVASAGMLVRRDVWEQVGGFDTGMGLFMEDIDFCWRVHSAGYRVRVITDAVCYHAQAASKHRRAISIGRRARMLDRRNGLLTLFGNLPFWQMAVAVGGNVLVSLLRITFFLLAKRLTAALDEAAAVSAVLMHPFRVISMRRRRSAGRRAAYSRVKADLPAGHSVRRVVEFAAAAASKSQADTTGTHHASADPTEDDSLLVDNGLGRRLLTSPALATFAALLAVALVAGHSLLGGGPLAGGSLVPAWGGASDLWHTYLQAFHPSGIGSSAPAPAYLAVLAVLATVLAGKPWLAIVVLLVGCVPLAGMSAMLAVRRITTSVPIRVWASVTYALLPVAMGVVASGRFGSALVFVLLPLIALTAGRVVTRSGSAAGRAAWATGFLVAVGSAFVPLLWLVALTGCVIAAIALRNTRPGLLRNLAIIALTAPVLAMPWTLTLFSAPAGLLLEAGLPQPGSPATGLSGKMLILLSPGGPGLPPYWVTGGLLLAAFAALFTGRRRRLIMAGWGLALASLLLAVVLSHLVVAPPDGGRVVVWAGLPLAMAALGLLLAASVGAQALPRLLAAGKGKGKGWRSSIGSARGAWVALITLLACSAPLLAAVNWLSTGVSGPVHHASSEVVPELVAVTDGQSRQVRTLVLRSDHGQVSYLLLRGASPQLGDPALTAPPDAERALAKVVAALITPGGGLAADQSQLLADFDIGYVLVQAPVDAKLSATLDDVSGLRTYSTTSSYALWQLINPPARVSVLEPNGTVVPIAAGQTGVYGAQAPAAGGILMLAEPAGGWSASLNGHALAQVRSPAGSWAQAFRLPAGGGTLDVGHASLGHDLWLVFELVALLAVVALALPGIGLAEDAPQAGAAPDQAAGLAKGAARGRRAAAGMRGAAGRRAAGSRPAAGAGADADDLDEAAELDDLAAAGSAAPGGAGSRAASRRGLAGTSSLVAARAQRGGRSRGKAGGRGKPARAGAAATGSRSGRRGPDSRDLDLRDIDRRDVASHAADSRDLDLGETGDDRLERARVGEPGPAAWPGRDREPERGGKQARSDRRPRAVTAPQAKAWPYASTPAGDEADEYAGGGYAPGGHAPDGYQDDDRYAASRPAARRSPSGSAPPPQWSARSGQSIADADFGQDRDYEAGGYRAGGRQAPRHGGREAGRRSGQVPDPYGADQYDPDPYGRYGAGRYEPGSYEPGGYEPGGYEPGGYESGRDGRQAPWPGAAGEALEPLPPAGPARAGRPGSPGGREDGAGAFDWRRPDRGWGRRRESPGGSKDQAGSGHPYESWRTELDDEYEGETW
jgi:GT2 family glycosyltransferase